MKEIEITRDPRNESTRGVKRCYVISTEDRCTYLISHTDNLYTIYCMYGTKKPNERITRTQTKDFGEAVRTVADMLDVTKEEILIKLLEV